MLFEASSSPAPSPAPLSFPLPSCKRLPSPGDFVRLALERQAWPEQEEPGPAQPQPQNPAPEEVPQKPFRIALTFDDGPGPYTARLLDGLAQYHARATFFVLGCRIPGNEELLVRMAQEGHEIGNHSYSHSLFQK